jgi:hypothetical protein
MKRPLHDIKSNERKFKKKIDPRITNKQKAIKPNEPRYISESEPLFSYVDKNKISNNPDNIENSLASTLFLPSELILEIIKSFECDETMFVPRVLFQNCSFRCDTYINYEGYDVLKTNLRHNTMVSLKNATYNLLLVDKSSETGKWLIMLKLKSIDPCGLGLEKTLIGLSYVSKEWNKMFCTFLSDKIKEIMEIIATHQRPALKFVKFKSRKEECILCNFIETEEQIYKINSTSQLFNDLNETWTSSGQSPDDASEACVSWWRSLHNRFHNGFGFDLQSSKNSIHTIKSELNIFKNNPFHSAICDNFIITFNYKKYHAKCFRFIELQLAKHNVSKGYESTGTGHTECKNSGLLKFYNQKSNNGLIKKQCPFSTNEMTYLNKSIYYSCPSCK